MVGNDDDSKRIYDNYTEKPNHLALFQNIEIAWR